MLGAYIELGYDHILDPQGYDHILFVVALCSIYLIRDWKKVLVLVTAFTIGHSLTLALSSLKIVSISSSLVEALIPITIVFTCLYNIFIGPSKEDKLAPNYSLAAGFGLIHGLGFSNFFKAMLGREESILMPLLSFNIGVELGQIIIVLATLLLSYILVDIIKVNRKYYNIGLSSIIALWAIWMMIA